MLEEFFLHKCQDISLKGKTALVTGASSGIGAATAAWLAREGAHVFLAARRGERLGQIQKEIYSRYPESSVVAITCDVNAKNILEILDSHGALNCDILINNAGGAWGRDSVEHLSLADLDLMVQTNFTSVVRITQGVLRSMIPRKSGHIVTVGSVAGHFPYAGGSIYCAMKAAIRSFCSSLRQETYDKNIRVSLVSPGMVETEFSLVRFKGDKTQASAVYQDVDCLIAGDIARAIVKVLKEPSHANVDELVVFPTVQSPVNYNVVRPQA